MEDTWPSVLALLQQWHQVPDAVVLAPPHPRLQLPSGQNPQQAHPRDHAEDQTRTERTPTGAALLDKHGAALLGMPLTCWKEPPGGPPCLERPLLSWWSADQHLALQQLSILPSRRDKGA